MGSIEDEGQGTMVKDKMCHRSHSRLGYSKFHPMQWMEPNIRVNKRKSAETAMPYMLRGLVDFTTYAITSSHFICWDPQLFVANAPSESAIASRGVKGHKRKPTSKKPIVHLS